MQAQGIPANPVEDESAGRPGSENADAAQPAQETGGPHEADGASQTAGSHEAGAQNASQSELAGPVFKRMATDFTAYDVEGNALRLSDYRGKPVIVNFFASWCGPCRIELPYFEAAYQTYGEQIEFLMVDLNGYGNDVAEDALAMIEEGGYTFPIRFDSDGEAALAYSVRSIPTTLLVAPDGELLGTQVGSMSEAMLAQAIAILLGSI